MVCCTAQAVFMQTQAAQSPAIGLMSYAGLTCKLRPPVHLPAQRTARAVQQGAAAALAAWESCQPLTPTGSKKHTCD
jgi:hypothetical protein